MYFERNISPIKSKDFNGIATAFFSNPYIGDWYLKEINENSIVAYHNGIPQSGMWLWQESTYNLKYNESEIVYCIMKKLSKYYKQNNRFDIEFNKYKAFFDGTLEEFLECLMNEYEDFSFYTGAGNYYNMNKIEGYDGLKDKLTEKVNNLSAPPAPEKIVKEIKDILKADYKHRNIINMYDELLQTHKDQKLVLVKMGRSNVLNVGTEKSTDKDRTDIIRTILKTYGRIKQKQRQS